MANAIDSVDPAAFLKGGGETGALIARHAWAATSIGPLSRWPQTLQTATAMILRATTPIAILWGGDGVMIYNDAYAAFVGDLHPGLLGAKVREGWPASADFLDEVMRLVLAGGCLTLRDREFALARAGRSEQVWIDVAYSPILDQAGEPAGALALITETTQRVLAERKAGLESERRRRMFAQGPGFICLLSGPDLVVEFTNEAHERLFGIHDAVGKPYREAFPEMVARHGLGVLQRVYATGERFVGRADPTVITKPGAPPEERFLDTIIQPIIDGSGQIVGVFAEGFDVTEQVRIQAAAKESERRLSAATAIARLGAFEWDLENKTPWMDDRAREIFGFDAHEPLTFDRITGRIEPEDHQRATSLRMESATRRHIEYRVRLPDGAVRYVTSVSDVVLGSHGDPARIIGIVADATERRRAEDHQRLLINELNHRVKNTLATVQSIAAQTLRAAEDTVAARAALESRLMALAATHDLLTAESWHGARIDDVVASAMAAFESIRGPQIQRSGPAVWITAHRALALSMALHELATNAAKYGALSRPQGRVTIRWRRAKQDMLALSWTEQGGPPVEPPTHSGFGTRLLQRSLARELNGKVSFSFAPEGVRCEFRFPVTDDDAANASETAAVRELKPRS